MALETIPLTESLGSVFDTAPAIAHIQRLVKSGEWPMPSGFEFIMPKENDRACRAPPGFIPIYYHMHRGGFRLPLLRFQRMIIREFNVLPSLLLPNAWTVMNGFDLASHIGEVEPSIDFFLCLFRRLSSNVNAWAFSAAPGKLWLDLPSSTKPEWNLFVFCKPKGNNWEFDTRWKAPDRLPPQRQMEASKAMGDDLEGTEDAPQRQWTD